MLLDFTKKWGQKCVIMHVHSKMIGAAFCYIKAALDLGYTVNLYDKKRNKVSDQIKGVETNYFILKDNKKSIFVYKTKYDFFDVTFLFSKTAFTLQKMMFPITLRF